MKGTDVLIEGTRWARGIVGAHCAFADHVFCVKGVPCDSRRHNVAVVNTLVFEEDFAVFTAHAPLECCIEASKTVGIATEIANLGVCKHTT